MIEHLEGDLSVFLLAGPPRVGVAQLRFREYLLTGKPTCYLEELYVVPDRRGEGHGLELMRTAMRVARERGATTIELGTAVGDVQARRLYEGLGFTNLEKEGDQSTQMLYYELELGPGLARPAERAGLGFLTAAAGPVAHRQAETQVGHPDRPVEVGRAGVAHVPAQELELGHVPGREVPAVRV